MAILKYYKVDSDGKIKRLRKECPVSFINRFYGSYSSVIRTLNAERVSSWPSIMTGSTAASAVRVSYI